MFHPIQIFADRLIYSALHIAAASSLGMALDFFVFDTIKILILLAVIVFVVSVIRSFLPAEKHRAILLSKGEYTGNVMASLLGIITPFCTCSAIPLFLGFVQAGVPLGVTLHFSSLLR